MGKIKNVAGSEALQKIREIAEGNTAMLCTFSEGKMLTRPMATQTVESDGSIWFMSRKDSNKNQHLAIDPTMQLIYAEHGSNSYLTLEGRGDITEDQEKKDELWTRWASTWFDGKDDPNLTLIRFTPEDGFYWDTKHGKMIAMVKMMYGAITGQETDDSREGKVNP